MLKLSGLVVFLLMFLVSCSTLNTAKEVHVHKGKSYELEIFASNGKIKIYPKSLADRSSLDPNELDLEVLYHLRRKEKGTRLSPKRNVSVPLFIRKDHFEGSIKSPANEFGLIVNVSHGENKEQFQVYFDNTR